MNKIKLSDSDKRLLIIFFAILLVAASYFFFFNKNMSKASDIEESNTKDQAQVQQMEQMEAALPQVRENIKDLKQKQENIIAKYPSDIKTEKVIWVLQDIEDHNDYHISNITFAMYNPLQISADVSDAVDSSSDNTTSDDTADASTETTEADTSESSDDSSTDTSEASGPVTGYYASIGVTYDATYDGLKDMLAYVNEFSDRITITSFTSAADSETGRLSGDMTFNMYVVTNTGKDYVEPKFDIMLKGVQNIFGNNVGNVSSGNN